MTEHIKVEESFVESLIEQAAWDAARLSLVEAGKKKAGQSKGDEPKGKAKKDDDKPDFETGARKGDKSKKKCPTDDDYEVASRDKIDAMKEDVEEHICPLCETILEEALTDEQIDEHVAQIYDALNTIEEADESEEDDVVSEEEETRESKVMAKVEQLKKAAHAGE